MSSLLRVDFHCHSKVSDGFYSAGEVAERLSGQGVCYAALTDHDSTAGLEAFEAALERRGIPSISGVEITVLGDDLALHVLGYGIDPADEALQALLTSRRERRSKERTVEWAIERLRAGALRPTPSATERAGWPSAVQEVVELIHGAGGCAFLAHPLSLTSNLELLEELLIAFKGVGLDGIEALYSSYSSAECQTLLALADQNGLLVSAGSDFHGPQLPGAKEVGIEMPIGRWKSFRDAVISRGLRPKLPGGPGVDIVDEVAARPHMKRFLVRILLPVLLVIGLFVAALFTVIVPSFKASLLQQKREMIHELTNSAWSVLAEYERLERSGQLTREQAQQNAAARIENMRYGKDGKDYFWITDRHPRMVMHPYKKDLKGQDLSKFEDPNGTKVFVELVKAAENPEQDGGYVEYVWQWKDDPSRLVPKQSFVKSFEPWGWVIGTGMYVDDVNREISQLSSRIIWVSLVSTALIVMLLLVVAQQSLRVEGERRKAIADLESSHQKYRALVEAATEGTLLLLEERCSFANKTMQEMLGYSAEEFALLDVFDLVGEQSESREETIALLKGREGGKKGEVQLRRKDGQLRDVVLSTSPVLFAGKKGLILSARDIGGDRKVQQALGDSLQKYAALTQKLQIGVIRAELGGSGRFIELNPAGARILGFRTQEEARGKSFFDFFDDLEERAKFLKNLQANRMVRESILRIRREDSDVSIVSVSAALSVDSESGWECFDALLDDITERKRADAERESLVSELQTSLLFLNESIKNWMIDLPACEMKDSIEKVAMAMTRQESSAMAVVSEGGEVIGIVTDQDMRERVIASQKRGSEPIFEIMSAPVKSVPEKALVFEAALVMQQNDLSHLAVRNMGGQVVGMVRGKDLMRFEHYSPVVLSLQIRKAQSLEEIAECYRKVPVLISTMIDSGANSRSVTRTVTTISDAIVERLVELAVSEMGPAPAPFALIALGSEGRGEQTLVTDQDNALIYRDLDGAGRPYFLELGARLCDGLNEVGFHYCRGGLMAKNPEWCQPLSHWSKLFDGWINLASPQDLLEINKFFDFRVVYGEKPIARELRGHINKKLKNREPFFKAFAENALLTRPPIGLFGQLVVGSKGAKDKAINIKEAMMLIVTFARLYALRHNLPETNTLDRLHRLYELKVLSKTQHREALVAYDFLMRLRLTHQAKAVARHEVPDNFIQPKKLSSIESGMLKQVFSQISGLQKKISLDFFGLA